MSAQIIKPQGATKRKKVKGRGLGSGLGKTAGKGTKGQNSRSGGGVRPGFEGGQMPLYRRIARRGFSNYPFRKEYAIIAVQDLNRFDDGEEVNRESLLAKGLLRSRKLPIKILCNGDIEKKLTFDVDKITAGALEKITRAGGEVLN